MDYGSDVPTPDCALQRLIVDAGLGSYADLVAKADADPEWFWSTVIERSGIRFFEPPTAIVAPHADPAWVEWLPGAKLNLASECLAAAVSARGPSGEAVVWEDEDGAVRHVSFEELATDSHALAHGLRRLGVEKGDRVGILMPMLPETLVAFFATALVGAVALPLFSGFGAGALSSRLSDAEAKYLILADGTRRRGRTVDLKATADAAARETPSLAHLVVFRSRGNPVEMHPSRDVWWHDILDRTEPPAAESVSAEHPLMIVYTSGTTGKPKGTIHTHGGLLLKVAADVALVLDMNRRDRVLWLGDFGWLTGPILVTGCTLVGATFVLAEGTPDHPSRARVWDLVQRHRITFFSLSPTLVRAQMHGGVDPREGRDLSSLRIMAATGEVWQPEAWRWCAEEVGAGRVPILNYTGGTEIGGSILSCNLVVPSKPCSVGRPVPGVGAAIAGAVGSGEPATGELILLRPSPGLTRGLYHARETYLSTYWTRHPSFWSHGDLVERDADGDWFVRGRVDDLLKVAGKRLGPVEVEGIVGEVSDVIEAAVTGVADEVKGEALAVFVVARSGTDPSVAVSAAIVQALGPAFAPKCVVVVPELPRTRSQKIMRGALRTLLDGRTEVSTTSMENPACLAGIKAAIEEWSRSI